MGYPEQSITSPSPKYKTRTESLQDRVIAAANLIEEVGMNRLSKILHANPKALYISDELGVSIAEILASRKGLEDIKIEICKDKKLLKTENKEGVSVACRLIESGSERVHLKVIEVLGPEIFGLYTPPRGSKSSLGTSLVELIESRGSKRVKEEVNKIRTKRIIRNG